LLAILASLKSKDLENRELEKAPDGLVELVAPRLIYTLAHQFLEHIKKFSEG